MLPPNAVPVGHPEVRHENAFPYANWPSSREVLSLMLISARPPVLSVSTLSSQLAWVCNDNTIKEYQIYRNIKE